MDGLFVGAIDCFNFISLFRSSGSLIPRAARSQRSSLINDRYSFNPKATHPERYRGTRKPASPHMISGSAVTFGFFRRRGSKERSTDCPSPSRPESPAQCVRPIAFAVAAPAALRGPRPRPRKVPPSRRTNNYWPFWYFCLDRFTSIEPL